MASIKLIIPEEPALRRLSASLRSALLSEGQNPARIDLRQSCGNFFRDFPWTGIRSKRRPLPRRDRSTVAQYFQRFNWDGVRRPSGEHPTEPIADAEREELRKRRSTEIAVLSDYFAESRRV